jgi:hypothetical protein
VNDDKDPVEAARLLAALVETLLPGAASWPSGGAVGVQAELANRILQHRGEAVLAEVIGALRANAAALLSDDETVRTASVAQWEANDPDLFGWVRDAAYHAYYENPFVVQAINLQGHPYKLVPHLTGYRLPRFDLQRDTPRHGRGGWIPTDAVRRVAVESLDLTEQRTTNRSRKQ